MAVCGVKLDQSEAAEVGSELDVLGAKSADLEVELPFSDVNEELVLELVLISGCVLVDGSERSVLLLD